MELSLRTIYAREAFLQISFAAADLRTSTCHSCVGPTRDTNLPMAQSQSVTDMSPIAFGARLAARESSIETLNDCCAIVDGRLRGARGGFVDDTPANPRRETARLR